MVGNTLRAAGFAWLVALSVACSDDDEKEETASGTCDGSALGYTCTEIEGSPATIDDEREACAEFNDTWTTEPCPTQGMIGCCRTTFAGDQYRECYYTGYTLTAMELEEDCRDFYEGTWTTGG
jgi:hypothetical protein